MKSLKTDEGAVKLKKKLAVSSVDTVVSTQNILFGFDVVYSRVYSAIMAGRRINFCSQVFSLVFTFCVLLFLALKGEYLMFGKHYSCVRLEATRMYRESDSASSLLLSASQVRRRRTHGSFLKCRVPYDVSGICSFQLKKLSGDVHPNPGPSRTGIKFPCGECQSSV